MFSSQSCFSLSISIQALYDYKIPSTPKLFIKTEFQFKHCTIISSTQALQKKLSDISIQALYDYKPAQIVFELYSTNDATDSGKDVVYKVKLVKNGDGSLITTATYTALWYNSRRRLFTPAASTLTTAGGVGTLTVKWTDGNLIDAADGLKHGSITVSITANY